MKRKKKLDVVLDVDGVLADFVAATLRYLLEKHRVEIRPSHINVWDIVSVPEIKPYKEDLWKAWAQKGYAQNLPVIEGTQETVALLRRYANIKFATAPMKANPTWIKERNAWLRRYFDARTVDITHTDKKSVVPGHFFVDDKPANIEEYAGVHKDAHVFLRLWPYNLSWAGMGDPGYDNGYTPILGLDDILHHVEKKWESVSNSRPAKTAA